MIETPLRPRIALEDGWEFIRQRVGRSWLKGHGGGGRPVELPHCWNASDTFEYGRTSYSGWGAYRRHATLPTTSADNGIVWNLRLGALLRRRRRLVRRQTTREGRRPVPRGHDRPPAFPRYHRAPDGRPPRQPLAPQHLAGFSATRFHTPWWSCRRCMVGGPARLPFRRRPHPY